VDYYVDYENVTDFEAALNAGEELTGKVVKFAVNEFVPNSTFGYNLQAGEHLNFCSAKNPGAKKGDTVIAKVTDIQSMLGSYIVEYELIEVIAGNDATEVKATEAETVELDNSAAKAEIPTPIESTDETTEYIQDTLDATMNSDYPNIEDFEAALNAGEDLIGKTVTFTVTTFVPNSAFGYNLQTGEHLNFCSITHPGVGEGDTITVKVTQVQSVLGSFIIYYEFV